MIYNRIDPETDELVECGGRIVVCATPDCINYQVEIEVADDPASAVQCGPCGEWVIPPGEEA